MFVFPPPQTAHGWVGLTFTAKSFAQVCPVAPLAPLIFLYAHLFSGTEQHPRVCPDVSHIPSTQRSA